MRINHSIINICNKIITKKINDSNYFRILNFHHIREENFDNIRDILISLSKDHHIINPKDLAILQSQNFKVKKKTLLITFDDGFFSQKNFAERVLEKLKIKAIFFVIPNFVMINDLNISKKFIKEHILESIKLDNFDKNMQNMKTNDLKYLVDSGHDIGMHSLNHTRLSTIKNKKLLEEEILSNLYLMEKILGIKILSFAYPYGDIKSINSESLRIINKFYKFIFSGIRGNNSLKQNTNLFWRDAIDDSFSLNLCEGFFRGFADYYYSNDRKKLTSMIKK